MKKIYLSPPDIGIKEINFIREAFESNFIAPLGPQVDLFEKEFQKCTKIKNSLAVSSGTAAMHLALKCLGVNRGDIVISSTLTFIGGVSPVCYLGGILKFIDSDMKTWNMDLNLLEEEIKYSVRKNKLPKAVLTTDIYGQCSDLENIRNICMPYNIPIVSDSCESLGSKYKGLSAGKGFDISVFSFNGNKIVTTSGGGMLASDNLKFIKRARYLSQQAKERKVYYEHKEIGYNYRMSNILAALGRGQLDDLEKKVLIKRKIFEYYKSKLGNIPGISFMPEADNVFCNRWLTVIKINRKKFGTSRNAIIKNLEINNIESRPVWKPMHSQPVFRDTFIRGGDVSMELYREGICLPSGTQLKECEMDKIISIIIKSSK